MQVKLRNWIGLCLILCFAMTVAKAAEMPDQIGVIIRFQGQVVEQPQGFERRPLYVGAPVHARSKINTGSNSRLEILFDDGSKMLLGEWANVRLDIKIKDNGSEQQQSAQSGELAPEEPESNSMTFGILSGTFRFITGLLDKFDNPSLRFQTQVATIGIRGTDFFGGPLAAGMPSGEIHYGFMILQGAIDVNNRHGVVTLDSPKEGTFLPMKGHKAPTPPSVWKQPAIDEAFASIEFN